MTPPPSVICKPNDLWFQQGALYRLIATGRLDTGKFGAKTIMARVPELRWLGQQT